MAITSQQIADAAGVSRGTVYRALHNKGRINPEVAKRIRLIAEKMNYQPNRAGQALARSGKSAKIGVIIQSSFTPFMQLTKQVVLNTQGELELLGAEVILEEIRDNSPEKVVQAMDELRNEGCNGIAMIPSAHVSVRDKIDSFVEDGIPVVTFNADLDSKRLCYVGQDAVRGGKTAAYLMAETIVSGGKLLIISGFPTNPSNYNRINGFLDEIKKLRSDVQILDIQYNFESYDMTKMITHGMLGEYRDLKAIYLASTGVCAVCDALDEANMSKEIKVISNDLTQENINYLKKGKIQFLLGQDHYTQGSKPIYILYEYLTEGKEPEKQLIYTDIVIKTKYNI